jgi:hypothetical protein
MATATVKVVSGTASLFSKSNVVQYVGVAASLLTMLTGGKAGLDAQQQGAIVTVILLAQSAVVWVMHRYFSPTVHASSLPSSS